MNYPETPEFIPRPYFHLHLVFPSDIFPSSFLTKTVYAFLFSPCAVHIHFLFITPIISGEGWTLEVRRYNVSSVFFFLLEM
jgi:hypothetical protein